MSDSNSKIRTPDASYRSRTTPLHVWHDSLSVDSISTTVVTAVARAASVDPTEMPPLFQYIDPDALDKLVGQDVGTGSRFSGYVTFDYASYSVTVHSDGEIVVTDLDQR